MVEDLSKKVASLAKRRGFYFPSYEIYGGVAGFYDYGPMGTIMKDNVLAILKHVYVLEHGFLSIDSSTVGPFEMFEASGHVTQFTDFLVRCQKCGASFRADHLLEEHHENPDSLDKEALSEQLSKHSVKCPSCGGELSQPAPFNLMFQTSIGPGTDSRKAFLRPETAQGIFVNFPYLLNLNRDKLPMGVFQIGRGFRNEISPRQGMLRVREFHMAEAEVFFHPDEMTYEGFSKIRDDEVTLLPDGKEMQKTTFGNAVEKGIIINEALAYFIHVTKKILVQVGVDPERLRFRQHESDEMAHYASDCWDAEALLETGWVELVGIADRSAYDLAQHQEATGKDMTFLDEYDQPVEKFVRELEPKMNVLGPLFGKDAVAVAEMLKEMDVKENVKGEIRLKLNGEEVTVPGDAYNFVEKTVMERGERIIPHVVEPSYGIGRIFYTVMEHSFHEDEEYKTLRLPYAVSPYKVGVFPLMDKDGLTEMSERLLGTLRTAGFPSMLDTSGSIGRRYARMDEVGTPFGITVDYESLEDGTVTIRERDTKKQVRVHKDKLIVSLEKLLLGADLEGIGPLVGE